MINVVITILLFNLLIIIFKLFEKFRIDNLQALIINYLVAGGCSYYFSEMRFSIDHVAGAPWLFPAIIIGILFIVSFNVYAKATQKVGIAIATISNRLSLLIPVCFALFLYPEERLGILKLLGLILAVVSIYLSSTKNKQLNFDQKYLGIIILLFVGQGVADTIFNYAQQTSVNDSDKGLFFLCLLFISAISGTLFLIGKAFFQRPQLHIKNLIGGLVLGIPNYFTLIYFFNSLEHSGLAPSQVFPVISMGVIVVSAVVGLLLFKERLYFTNWIGLGLAVLAIFLITFF